MKAIISVMLLVIVVVLSAGVAFASDICDEKVAQLYEKGDFAAVKDQQRVCFQEKATLEAANLETAHEKARVKWMANRPAL